MSDSIDDVTPGEWDSLRRSKRAPHSLVRAMPDAIEKPQHYTSGGVECIDYIKQQLGDVFPAYLEGNIVKYVHRHKVKCRPLEDLRKARVYLNWLIKELENEG